MHETIYCCCGDEMKILEGDHLGQSRGGLFKSKGGGGSMYYLEEVDRGREFLGEINTSGLVVVCFRVKVEEQQV